MPYNLEIAFLDSELYRYGYQGSERDDAVKGEGNSYTTFYRRLDPRLGRWLSVDPKAAIQSMNSPYLSMNNNPIIFNDPLGDIVDIQGNSTKLKRQARRDFRKSFSRADRKLLHASPVTYEWHKRGAEEYSNPDTWSFNGDKRNTSRTQTLEQFRNNLPSAGVSALPTFQTVNSTNNEGGVTFPDVSGDKFGGPTASSQRAPRQVIYYRDPVVHTSKRRGKASLNPLTAEDVGEKITYSTSEKFSGTITIEFKGATNIAGTGMNPTLVDEPSRIRITTIDGTPIPGGDFPIPYDNIAGTKILNPDNALRKPIVFGNLPVPGGEPTKLRIQYYNPSLPGGGPGWAYGKLTIRGN